MFFHLMFNGIWQSYLDVTTAVRLYVNTILLAIVLQSPPYWLEETNCHGVKAMLENSTWQAIIGNL